MKKSLRTFGSLLLGCSMILPSQIAYAEETKPLDETINNVSLTILNGEEEDEITTYVASLTSGDPYKNQKVYDEAVKLKENSGILAELNMETSKLSTEPEFQIINSETTPTLPITDGTWTSLGDLGEVEYNIAENYMDYLPEQGLISAQHYLFVESQKIPPKVMQDSKEQHPRVNVFQYPVNGVVKQSTLLNDNKTYSTQEGAQAFFQAGSVNETTLYADFVPKETGTYYFGVVTAQTADGYITVDGKKTQFVYETSDDHGGTYGELERTNKNGEKLSFYLEAGKSYPIELKTKHTRSERVAPSFQYSFNNDTDWKLVTPDLLLNQNPTNGASRAVKLWGFIEPDVTGTFNFGMLADDGAYGYINVAGENIVFVDSFALSQAVDQSNGVEITVEAGKVYPIYMEWYEGCPYDQCLMPRYKEPGGKWKDIPNNWFHPSSSTTVAEHAEAMYNPTVIQRKIPLPKEGRNYIVLKLTDKNGEVHQVLYGPFETRKVVTEVLPNNTKDTNCIVPTTLSNFNSTITYQTTTKAIQYTVDLKNIAQVATSEGKSCFEMNLAKADIQIIYTDASGNKKTTMISSGENEKGIYTKEIDQVNNQIVIKVAEDEVVEAGASHTINIYFPTDLNGQVKYGPETQAGTYLNILKNETCKPKVQLTISRKPVMYEAFELEEENIKLEAEFVETPVTSTEDVEVELKEMPKVY